MISSIPKKKVHKNCVQKKSLGDTYENYKYKSTMYAIL